MDCHVTAMSKATFCSIRNIGRIRKHLTRDAAETIIHAFVTSKLDLNNSLLYGITNTQVARLQRLQNIAARIITILREPITYLLCLQIYTGYQLNKDPYTSCTLLFIKLCTIRHQNILLTLLNHIFLDIVHYAPQQKDFYRKEIQKINGSTSFMEQSATSCKKFELYHKFQEKPENTFILGGI